MNLIINWKRFQFELVLSQGLPNRCTLLDEQPEQLISSELSEHLPFVLWSPPSNVAADREKP